MKPLMILKSLQKKQIFSSIFFIAFVLGFILLILKWKFFFNYFLSPMSLGLDGFDHVSLGKYYADNIFPSVWGWADLWYFGMPFPQFYTPLFYIIIAFLYKILPFSYISIFKFVVVFLTLAIPGGIAWLTRAFSGRKSAGWFAGLISIILLLAGTYKGRMGIDMESTFRVGLVTQLLGFVIFIFWVNFLARIDNSKKAFYLSTFLLFLMFLSSAHMIPVAVIFFLVFAVVLGKDRVKTGCSLFVFLKPYVLSFILAILGASFWYVPMIGFNSFAPSLSLGIANGIGLPNIFSLIVLWIIPILISLVALFVSYRRKEKIILALAVSSFVLWLPAIFRFDLIFPSLPIHTFRYLAPFYFLSAVFGGYLLGLIFDKLRGKMKFVLCAVFLSVFLIFFIADFGFKNDSFSGAYQNENISEIVSYMKGKTGVVNIEAGKSGRALNYFLAQSGVRTDYAVFAESSISSLFLLPFRNSFSLEREVTPVQANLGKDQIFLRGDIDTKLKRAEFLGVNRFFMTDPLPNWLIKNSRISLEKDFGFWKLFKLEGESSGVASLSYEPAVVFAPVKFKNRGDDRYGFVRFQEELFKAGVFDVILSDGSDYFLDTTKDLDKFKNAVVSEYEYRDMNKAFERLKAYSVRNNLVLISSSDPLFLKLKELGGENYRIKIFDREKTSNAETNIIEYLNQNKIAVKSPPKVSTSFSGENIAVSFISDSAEEKPVLIKSSYFPTWKNENGGEVYLSSPTFMLTFATSSFNLVFETPKSVYIGYILSACGATSLLYLLFIDFRKKKNLVQ